MTAHVLIVDDEPDIVLTLRMILEVEGLRVDAAASAEEALGVLEGSRPDVVLLDVGLPGMDGWQFLEEIGRSGAFDPARVVVVTAHVTASSPARAREFGCGYLPKPFRSADVMRAVLTAAEPARG